MTIKSDMEGRWLRKPYIQTPLIPSLYLSKLAGCRVLMKMETCQSSGSFKSRGLGYLVQQTLLHTSPNPGQELHFFSSSGGNAGYATAVACQQYRQKCTVCVPLRTSSRMVDRIRMTGATVISHGQTIGEADKYLHTVLMTQCDTKVEIPIYCHPYNNPIVWKGNSTLASEIIDQTDHEKEKVPSLIICSVGGGGLYNGLVSGFLGAGGHRKKEWKEVPILAVETTGCATLYKSLKAQSLITQQADDYTIALSLATPDITPETLEYANGLYPTHSIIVEDRDAANACIRFAEDHKVLVEPACGTALAAIYQERLKEIVPKLTPDDTVVVVVCGGSAVDCQTLQEYRNNYFEV
ncbi:tryptophan synthase beta subunit-like PLP-dependent enzyme [Nadsonia fulvescens var. elongata DSM 6958]|uniref:L-serine ammonia-lyase n=1 Tax=Nadsonia fulvescens var. elongata DSM 6958 TaxID=857566 RepID=A0A1E3PD10_9ASCO|nr:tryptophan synthase beta subunit-like PLP-dependent enzyme [Nadsonia fulvescens var. elongata DSM 6958]